MAVDGQDIREAYQPFVKALRGGGFVEPSSGWGPSLIAAHVAANNDAIASVAEQIAGGDHPSYDNIDVIDDDLLSGLAESAGSLETLAELVTTSAERLARAHEVVGGERGATEVPATIRNADDIVREAPIPIREFIEGNATYHLQLHLDQLNELRP